MRGFGELFGCVNVLIAQCRAGLLYFFWGVCRGISVDGSGNLLSFGRSLV